MASSDREQLWQARVAEWQAGGKSQRAYAIEHGFPVRQFGYWVRRFRRPKVAPALLPAQVVQAARSDDESVLTLSNAPTRTSWMRQGSTATMRSGEGRLCQDDCAAPMRRNSLSF